MTALLWIICICNKRKVFKLTISLFNSGGYGNLPKTTTTKKKKKVAMGDGKKEVMEPLLWTKLVYMKKQCCH